MTDLTIPVIALCLGGAGLTALDLTRRDQRDVLGAVEFLVLGLALGAVLQIVFPAGVVLGGIGGASLAAARFAEIRRSRRRAIEEEVGETDALVERVLLLHDRLDRVQPEPKLIRKIMGIAGVSVLSLFAAVLLLVGLAHAETWFLFLGGLAAFPPVAGWAVHAVKADEYQLLCRALAACEDEAAGVLPEGNTRRITGDPGVA